MKRWITLTILVVTGLSALWLADHEYRAQIHQENGRALAQASTDTQSRLQEAFTMRLQAVENLQAFMLASAALPDNETFDHFAAGVLDHYPDIRGLAYIDSNRIVRYFYPLEGNESAIGLDLMTRPAAPFVEEAIQERRTTVNDPTVNVMGSLSVIPRTPLYRGDQLLGLVEGVFDVSAILEDAMTGTDPRFVVQLRDANGNRFWGVETFSSEMQTLPVQVGDNAWTLTIGWKSLPPGPAPLTLGLIWGVGGALLLSLLFIVNRTWTQTEWLRATVSKRTEALHESEARLEEAQRIAHVGSWEWIAETDTPTWSKELCAILEVDPTKPVPSVAEQDKLYTPESMKRMRLGIEQATAGIPYEIELERVREDGTRKWLLARGEPRFDKNGHITGLRGTALDITERKRAEAKILHINRLYATISQINQTIVRAQDRDTLFSEICRVATEHGKFRMAWIGLIDDADGYVRPIAFAGEEQGYLTNISIAVRDRKLGGGPTGIAIREGRCIICQDIATDPRMAPWREQAMQRGYRSSAAVPIRRKNQLVGVLTVYAADPQGFDDDDQKLLDEIGQDISYALDSMDAEVERKQAEDKLRESEGRLLKAQHITHMGFLDWHLKTNIIFLSDEIHSLYGLDPEQTFTTPELVAKVVHPEDVEYVQKNLEMAIQGVKKYDIDHRIVRPDRKVIWVHSQAELVRDASGNPETLLGTSIDITGRKNAEERIKRQLEQLTALNEIDRMIASGFDLHLSLASIVDRVISQQKVDAADILLMNPDMNILEFGAGQGFRISGIEKSSISLGQGYAGRAALERQTIHISDLRTQVDNPVLQKAMAGDNFVSYYAVPLIAKGKVKGVLEVFHRSPLDPDFDWLNFLNTLAGQAAIAIDSASLFENLQVSNMELILAYDATIEGWSRALDLRDKETEGHTLRVTDMAVKLATAFGMNNEALAQIRRGALLHDIGKMGVLDGILLKPGELTDEEWVAMKKHPTFAYEMLAPIRFLKGSLDIPYCHHEKWDGTGYPQGLKGEQIPLAARIFAVADVWDALTSDRVYRKAWPHEKALDYIKSQAGIHFDPQVVKICFESGVLKAKDQK